MLKNSVPIKNLPFLIFRRILELSCVDWRCSTPRFSSLQEQENEKFEYFILRVGIKPIIVALHVCVLAPGRPQFVCPLNKAVLVHWYSFWLYGVRSPCFNLPTLGAKCGVDLSIFLDETGTEIVVLSIRFHPPTQYKTESYICL